MEIKEIIYKIKFKLHEKLIIKSKNILPYKKYIKLYYSYWHYYLKRNKRQECNYNNYMTARPNPGAGIGHQMANWIAGYWFAKKFGLKFAHTSFSTSRIPFSISSWDSFLGFGEGECQRKVLIETGYKLVLIPLFDEYNDLEINTVKKIINSYSDQKVVFMCEQDQFYHDQFGVIEELQHKFYNAEERKNDKFMFEKNYYNIAIHIRRGDILQKEGDNNESLTMRWLDNAYYVNALRSTLEIIKTNKPIRIYVFSQGDPEDYKEFNEFTELYFCLDMSAKNSFLHMCFADALITSKSSFSYKPALINPGIKICPQNFWHGYPDDKEWILVDDEGNFVNDYN